MIMADAAMTYKVVAKEIAHRNGCFASFMPKPIYGVAGSGMHVHQSLFKGGRNAFYDKETNTTSPSLPRATWRAL